MNISMKWLSDYIDLDVTPKEFSDEMTMSGSKVEGYEKEGDEIKNVVVGKVLSMEKHPNADSLIICKVDVGEEEPVQIVTGATNLFEGAVIPVAKDGALLPNGVKIKKGKLRGEVSCGMLCSLSELNLTINDFPYADEDGIFIIEEECAIGQDIQSAIGLNDLCVEFEITSNRPDCMSVIGIAREASATFAKPYTVKAPVVKGSGDDIANYLNVEVKNTILCPRYTAKVVKNVKIEPSPRWMRERLRAAGVRPISNIVDITNYVMLEYGQPMHAFDHKYVNGNKIVVRNAYENEKIMTLDGAERVMTPDMLAIADEKSACAVAGVMGGEFSSIMDDTKVVVFESANFLGSSVRITAKNLGMRTESSGRFEKGLDPQNTLPAVLRACELVELLGAGEVVDGIIDVDSSAKEAVKIKFEPEWINKFIGIDVSDEDMIKILKSLDFDVVDGYVIVPTFRADIEHKADVAEEVARIYGYSKIPTHPLLGTAQASLTPMQIFERKVSNALLSQGLNEIVTYSFISPKYYDKIKTPEDSLLRKSVVISNPLGEDTSIMRTTTLPSMLEVLSKNYNYRNATAYLYELGTKYIPTTEDKLPNELKDITIGMYGAECDFYKIKGIIEAMASAANIPELTFTPCSDNPSFHPGRTAIISCGDCEIGIVGEAHPTVAENYEIDSRVYLATLSLEKLFTSVGEERKYKPLPKYPATTRDIALLCDDDTTIKSLQNAIKSAIGDISESVELFDVYKGSQIPENKKSVAFNITLRASDRTLTVEEADSAVKKSLKAVEKLGAVLR